MMMEYSWENVLLQIKKESIEVLARANVNKYILFDILVKNNISSISVDFDGSGDSGSIREINISPNECFPILEEPAIGFHWPSFYIKEGENWPGVEVSLKDAIETICYDFLRAKHNGWENNEGAYGNFLFDVENKKVRLEYTERTSANYIDEF